MGGRLLLSCPYPSVLDTVQFQGPGQIRMDGLRLGIRTILRQIGGCLDFGPPWATLGYLGLSWAILTCEATWGPRRASLWPAESPDAVG